MVLCEFLVTNESLQNWTLTFVLMQYIKKNFNTTSKTVYIYVFCLFFLELMVVKIDHVSVLGNYNRNSIWVRRTASILAGCVKQSET